MLEAVEDGAPGRRPRQGPRAHGDASWPSGSASPGSAQWTPVGDLSGGERRRLQLLRLLMDEPNVLLLDEPTNDLDIDTLTALEDLLDGWPGTLLVVSHDRYFLERVCDRRSRCSATAGARPARRRRRVPAAARGRAERTATPHLGPRPAGRRRRPRRATRPRHVRRARSWPGSSDGSSRLRRAESAAARASWPRTRPTTTRGRARRAAARAAAERAALEEEWLEPPRPANVPVDASAARVGR